MRTTLTLEADVEEHLRREAQRTGKPFKQVVNEAIRNGLALAGQAAALDRFVVTARPLGLRPGLDYDDVADLLEVAEGAPNDPG